MIYFSYPIAISALILLVVGLIYLSNAQMSERMSLAKFLGITFTSTGGFFLGYLSLLNSLGAPIERNTIKSFYEIRLERRIDQSLSLVKTVDGDDKRVVKDIPIEVREGDIFMIKDDGSVVVIKSPPNQPNQLNADEIGG